MRGVTHKYARSPALEVLMKWITSERSGMLPPCPEDGRPDSPEIVCPKNSIVIWRRGRSTPTRTGRIDFPAMRSSFGSSQFCAASVVTNLTRNDIAFFAVQIDVEPLALDLRCDAQADGSAHEYSNHRCPDQGQGNGDYNGFELF